MNHKWKFIYRQASYFIISYLKERIFPDRKNRFFYSSMKFLAESLLLQVVIIYPLLNVIMCARRNFDFYNGH